MKHTKESLTIFTSNELIDLVLALQQSIEEHPSTIEAVSNINADTLLSWLKTKRRGDFVIATKKDIVEHFKCTSTQYSKYMRALYANASLSENRQYGKRVTSSHKIND